jgi:mercuric ion transport protein
MLGRGCEEDRAMNDRKLLGVGFGGSALAAVCCFTPALVLLLGAVGLWAWLAWLDDVLFPALVLFLGITAYALLRRRRA